MKNKEKLKKFLIILSLYTIFVIFLTYSINKYEYQVYKDNFDTKITSIILKIKEDYPNITIVFISTIFLIFLFLRFNTKKDREINKITKCLEEINKRNYKIDIEEMSEDELSILKNELYKVTIKLKEDAENSKQAKKDLKDTLADISHQLKTPITSVLIILDKIYEWTGNDVDSHTITVYFKRIRQKLGTDIIVTDKS